MKKGETNGRFRLVIREIREGPQHPRDIVGSQGLSERTVDACLKRGVFLGIFQRLSDGRYAWIDYSLLEEEIVGQIQKHRENHPVLEDLAIVDLATLVGKPPDDAEFQEAFWSAAKRTDWNIDKKEAKIFKPSK